MVPVVPFGGGSCLVIGVSVKHSGRPLRCVWGHLVFLQYDQQSESRQNRILKRDGERLLQMFNEKWLKYESIYFNHYKIKDKANIVIKDMDVLNVR